MSPGLSADFEQKLDLERLQIRRHLAWFDRELRHRRAGEAALRTNAQSLHRCKAAGLIEAAKQVIFRLQSRIFRTDDSKIRPFTGWQVLQRRKIAGAHGIVFEEERVNVAVG